MSNEYISGERVGNLHQAEFDAGEAHIDPRYLIEENVVPPHNPSDGYYLFRGIPSKRDGDYIGASWTEIPHVTYGFSAHSRGELYVAHMSVDEIDEIAITWDGNLKGQGLHEQPPAGMHFWKDPSRLRLATAVELTNLLEKVSLGAALAPEWPNRIHWRLLSRDVFGRRA